MNPTLYRSLFIFLSLFLGACFSENSKNSKTLYLATWSNYAPQSFISEFETQTGIKVIQSNYSSNEELLAKLQAGATGYDLIVPSDYMVFVMQKLGLLTELDSKRLPALSSLHAKLTKHTFDPKNQYSVPYTWGTTGIMVNRKRFKGSLKGWRDLLFNPELKGKVTLLDDAREALSVALRLEGFSINTKDQNQINQAKKTLLERKSQLKAFSSEPKQTILAGDAVASQIYSTDALQARAESQPDELEYIIPVEGGTLWIDNFSIPKGAKNLDAAYEFLNYVLNPQVQAQTTQRLWVAPTISAAIPLLPELYKKDRGLIPGDEEFKRFEMMEDLGEAISLVDRAWTEIKAEVR